MNTFILSNPQVFTNVMAESEKDRRSRFLSVYFDDPNIKRRLRAAAKGEGRTPNNFVNVHIVPLIEKALETAWADFERRGREELAKEGDDDLAPLKERAPAPPPRRA